MGNCGSSEAKKPAVKQPKVKQQSREIDLVGALDAVKADVLMISGCQDAQTSADLSDVKAILKEKAAGAPDGAGGACTSSLLHVTGETPAGATISWIDLLRGMRAFLKQKEYKQIPQLSTTNAADMSQEFSITGGKTGNKYAMLTGINYKGTPAELSGCVNDVCRLVKFIKPHGFKEDKSFMKVFLDPIEKPKDSDLSIQPQAPTRKNLMDGIRWIADAAQDGDCVFFHYSGHGTQVPDEDGSEDDGMDEALVPMDYATANPSERFITDDDIFKYLVSALKPGVRLFALMDCCHSGTIFDLPYTVKADDMLEGAKQIGKNHEAFAKLHGKMVYKDGRRDGKMPGSS